MADDYLFYEEDYEDISDWDEASDENNMNDGNEEDEEEKKEKVSMCVVSDPSTLTVPYIATSTSASFIVHKYAVFTSKELKEHMKEMIASISATLNIDDEMVSLLLRRYDWKSDRLMENYLSDSRKCLKQHTMHLIDGKKDETMSNAEIECPICVSDVKLRDTFSLGCNHRFCNECWTDYIASNIHNKSFNSILIECPGHKCLTPLKNTVIRRFCADSKEWTKYENYMVQSYVTCNDKSYRFCPSPGCKYIIYCMTFAKQSRDSQRRLCLCSVAVDMTCVFCA
eukprot:79323_1